MTRVDPALLILLAEALGVLILLVLAAWLLSRRKRGQELTAMHQFVDQMEESAPLKNKPLDQLLSSVSGLNREQVDEILQEVTDAERALFLHIMQLFLKREMSLLREIDESIGNLSEPYCRVIRDMLGNVTHQTMQSSDGDKQVGALERVNQQLVRQLETAMQTIDEITTEYTRVFSGQQTELELENSRKKMLQVFHDAEQQLKQSLQEPHA